ncbi:hypothetical protein [Melittangium boletus]|uniref:Uncharacterized protein n=1 Tax=Melittangium boletus DSM 14713 TaxID=1294270 RepID=A0A250IEK1_9BACT|nr:hypothetical protein [Melittangium boletus]ATB29571.1 hypothetical protein MEBOL_003026 [Melittangium boletus DSM 14713]
MATTERKDPTQPAEDMFGRPTSPRHDEESTGPSREAQGEQQLPPSEHGSQARDKDAEDEEAYGGVGELPDGDGIRSDKGTNPLPSNYWSAYPTEPLG